MSVIIRLQNLPWSANASDIREFFKGLAVPEGGVHIVGGEMGDAFIAFATDEDARIAMMKSGELLKGLQVTLHLSSRTQMQKVIETARQQVTGNQMFVAAAAPTPEPTPAYQPPVQSSIPTTQAQTQFTAMQSAPIMQPASLVTQPMNPIVNSAALATSFASNPAMSMYRPEDVQQNSFPPSFPGQMPQQQPQFNGNQPFFPSHIPIQQNIPQDQAMAKSAQNFGQNPVGHVQQYYDPQQIPKGTTQPAMGPTKTNSDSMDDSPQIISVTSPDQKDRRESPIRDKRRDSRDGRRRRTRSRSRSRSRDRRRRHRSRSRSRSKDRSSRRRRSRSHDRSNNRDRRDRPRSHQRDRPENDPSGSNNVKPRVSPASGIIIPGLGDPSSNSSKASAGILSTKPEGSPRTSYSRWGPRSTETKSTERSKLKPDDAPSNYRSGQGVADRSSPQASRPPYGRNGPNDETAGPRYETDYRSNQWRKENNQSNDGPNGRPRWDKPDDRSRETGNSSQWHSDNRPSNPPDFNRGVDRAPGDQPFDPIPPVNHRGMPFDHRGRGRGMAHAPYDMGPGRGFARGRGRGGIRPEAPHEKKMSCSIEVLKVPPGAPYSAIRAVFEGILMRPNSIKILGDPFGNPIGVALLRFTNTRDTCDAFKRAGSYIGNSCIEINFIDDAVFDNAVDINVQREGRANRPLGPPIRSSCLRITGLPLGCTDQDVAQIFSDVKINDIQLEFDPNGKPMGCCIVKLATPDQAVFSLNRLVNITMDKQALDIQPCPEARYQSLLATKKNIPRADGGHDNSKKSKMPDKITNSKVEPAKTSQDVALGADLLTDSVIIKHAPKNVKESDIRGFLQGLSTEKVHIKASDSDQTSQVYVTFGKIEDASQATKKSNQQIGNGRVQITLVSKPDVMKAMGLPFNPLELFNKSKANKGIVGSLNSGTTEKETGPGFDKSSQSINRDSNGPSSGTNGMHPSSTNNRGPMSNGPPHAQSMGRGANDFSGQQNPPARPASSGRNIAPDNFGLPGCVVAMGNVPYTAQTEDILYFFRDFGRLTADRVIRRYDEQNRPTADACVALPSPQIAQQAVQTLNRKFMYNRPINISLVQ